MALVDANGTRLWVETEGSGPAVLFLHGGLGDSRLWAPVAERLTDHYRTIRYDYRHYGRSDSPGGEFATLDDLFAVLDALDVASAALVGLSLGGSIALDAALAQPERVWAVAHVAGAVTGLPLDLATDEEYAAYEAAVERGDLDAAMDFDFEMWAPLGADDHLRELWLATPDARGVPEGATARPRPPANVRLHELTTPTLVIVATHDPQGLRDHGSTVARSVPGARLVELESDHYLTLREPDRIAELLGAFLTSSTPSNSSY
ncbi:MAG TPA: alpha/beta fold hydrolase [Gaiellaceae bacterium]